MIIYNVLINYYIEKSTFSTLVLNTCISCIDLITFQIYEAKLKICENTIKPALAPPLLINKF